MEIIGYVGLDVHKETHSACFFLFQRPGGQACLGCKTGCIHGESFKSAIYISEKILDIQSNKKEETEARNISPAS